MHLKRTLAVGASAFALSLFLAPASATALEAETGGGTSPLLAQFVEGGGTADLAVQAAPAIGYIYNQSGKCLEIENSSKSNGARAQQWDCKGQGGSKWGMADAGGGTYYLVNAHSGKCLEIENSSTANGARAQQWDCKGQAGSKWKFYVVHGQSAKVVNAKSGKCLEIENSSKSNGARAQQWDCNGQLGAYWH
ncbi:RICIN domain-containing protein [Streptomyces erythrochromogenes]|uniref:RICIN domain-containing protein n=1 Tax=Streptomyces erythrochromogenes TaxID=285574 RepID=UPI0038681B1B|nr:RICIN domain-containing protein [Streptomyces erythrochromogenes]